MKARFETLDGLRGIAALAIMALHGTQAYSLPNWPENAALAVDFFFILSGFVLSHAYDAKLGTTMTAWRFMRSRLIRLGPMLLIGTTIGAALSVLNAVLGGISATEAATTIAASYLLLPAGLLFHRLAYPLNNPMWSLFFELAANLVFALTIRWSGRLLRFGFLTLSALALAVVCFWHGTIENVGFEDPASFLLGFVRVTFPFAAGVALHRSGVFDRLPSLHPLTLAAVLGFLLCWRVGPGWLWDMAMVLFAFPLIVAFGAASRASAATAAICEWLGDLSYPLYAIHHPIVRMGSFVADAVHLAGFPRLLLLFASWGIAIAAAAMALKLYDEPFRRILANLFTTRPLRQAPAAAVVVQE